MITSTYVKSKKQYTVSFQLAQERVGENRDVRVLGSFNDWSWDNGLKLKSGEKGYTGETQLPNGTYQFRYLVDGQHWVNDESADTYTDSGHGSTNCCFSLEEVGGEEKKPAAKKKDTKIEAAQSAPATKPVVDPEAEKQKSEKQTAAKQDSDTASGTKKADGKKTDAKKPAAKKSATKKATKKKSDDLKKIEGIGPKIAGLLNEAGITSFAELAKATEKQLADVLQKAGARFRLAQHDTWSEQAQLAADGKTDELKKLQDSLKGGKK
ncbi:DUF4332 domain-containing protein [Neolewinella sp.]|uniref:DUF4332 domain-containing protein n=1 Tax=Neolewinella sp. TaxID=2993543 RepID=UPI003B51A91A